MSNLGELLRKAREEKGYSLDDIQEMTKIQKRYLEAIESGNYKVLPGKFYIRAFVKNYADSVGLDSDEVLNYFHNEVPQVEQEVKTESLSTRKPRRMRSRASERFGKIGFHVLMWSFLILIAVVIWYFYAFNKETENPSTLDQTPFTNNTEKPAAGDDLTNEDEGEVVPVSPTPTVAPTPKPEPITVTFVEKSGQDEIYTISSSSESLSMNIKVSSGTSWLAVYEGGKKGERLFYANASDGDSLTYPITKDMYVIIGRPDFVELSINNVVVDDGNQANKTKRWLFQLEKAGEGVPSTEGTEPSTTVNP